MRILLFLLSVGTVGAAETAIHNILDRDYFTIPSDQIDDIQVLETWIAGERVYRRD
jgi:predicted amidohydrolase YtcJ